MTHIRRPFGVALAVVAVIAGATVASAASGPVFVALPSERSPSIGVSYPVSVSGTYTPLAMDCLGEKRVLWYAPGAATDSLWRNLTFPATGSPTFTNVPVAIAGTYQPFTGDFDGDGCEDVFWYAPGAGADSVWYFAADGSFTSVAQTVAGSYQPVVGSFDATTPDDIYWFGGAAATEVIWRGSTVRGSFASSAAPQIAFDAQAVLVATSSSILFDAVGTTDDRVLEGVVAGSTTPRLSTASPLDLGRTFRHVGGAAMALGTGLVKDLLVTSLGRVGVLCVVGTVCPPPRIALTTSAGTVAGGEVVANSTLRAGFGVFHGPGTAPDAFVMPRQTGTYQRQPVAVGGVRPNGQTVPFAISSDGSKVLLRSTATNLVSGDTNSTNDVFVWDRVAGTYQRQANGADGAQPNDQSVPVGISADGRLVALMSYASNLVADDTNAKPDVFVWDRVAGTYQRQPNGVGGAQPNDSSIGAAFSADGSKVLLSSLASNLVAGDTNVQIDAFVWDRVAGTYQRQPNGVGGAQPSAGTIGVAMSADTTKVLLNSVAGNLVSGDTNDVSDAYVWNRTSGTYVRQPNGFGAAQPNGATTANAMSADGTKILLSTSATNLRVSDTNGAQDVAVWDTTRATYTLPPNGADGAQPNRASSGGGISASGTRAVVVSAASNLAPGDTNGLTDVFVWDIAAGYVLRQPFRVDGRQPAATSVITDTPIVPNSTMSSDGTVLALGSADKVLAGGLAGTAVAETFVWDLTPG